MLKRIFVDTSAWYALVDRNDPDYGQAKLFLKNNKIPLVTTNFIFDETITLLRSRFDWNTAKNFGQSLKSSNFVNLISIKEEDEEMAWKIFLKYKDQDFSYTDCTSFAIMNRSKIDTAFTFDSHYFVMNFNILPELRE